MWDIWMVAAVETLKKFMTESRMKRVPMRSFAETASCQQPSLIANSPVNSLVSSLVPLSKKLSE
eukprot:4492079-Pleurochrysis_carterae.AAC.1